MYKIMTISCYFGTFPSHFPEFMKSVACNPTVDFLLVTDCKVDDVPANMRVYPCSFAEMKDRLQALFDFPIVLDRPYKLCDYKPVWGAAFREYIDGYDFWGYCDIDLIFGDIRKFLPDEVLDKYDKIYKLGHLTYYRNTEENNLRYRLDGGVNYRTAFTTSEITAFDEIAGMQNIYDRQNFLTYVSRDYADITYQKYRFTLSYFQIPEELREENNYDKQLFYWENGHIYRAYLKNGQILCDEFNYIHFSRRKMERNGLAPKCDSFYITNRGMFPKTSDITVKDINKCNGKEPLREALRALECYYDDIKRRIKYYWRILRKKVVSDEKR